MRESPPDAAKVHGALRDLVHVFEGLSNNAEAFMAGLARTIELQRAEVAAVISFKTRLIDYLQRFIGDLVTRSSQIAELLVDLRPHQQALLQIATRLPLRPPAVSFVRNGQSVANVAELDRRVLLAVADVFRGRRLLDLGAILDSWLRSVALQGNSSRKSGKADKGN